MNFSKLVQTLVQSKVKQAEIARHCGIARSSVIYAMRNPDWMPSYPVGDKLIELARRNGIKPELGEE